VLSALESDPKLAGLLMSSDRRTAAVIIETEDHPGDDRYKPALISALRGLAAEMSGWPELHLTGVGVQKYDVARYIRRDQAVLIPLSVLTIAALLALIFRRLSGVLLPLAVTGISLIWTLGIYSLGGFSLNTITSLIPPVIMVLSVTTSVHVYSAWLRLAGEPDRKIDLIARETRILFHPCLFTALTTAIGLSALTLSSTPAVRMFGMFGAMGVMISFGVGVTLIPVGLSYLPLPCADKVDPHGGFIGKVLNLAARVSTTRPRMVLAAAIIPAMACVVGMSLIRNNTGPGSVP
jgi:predicted RND superfamily exporter protein